MLLDILCCPPYPEMRKILFVPPIGDVTSLNIKEYRLANKGENKTALFDFLLMISGLCNICQHHLNVNVKGGKKLD